MADYNKCLLEFIAIEGTQRRRGAIKQFITAKLEQGIVLDYERFRKQYERWTQSGIVGRGRGRPRVLSEKELALLKETTARGIAMGAAAASSAASGGRKESTTIAPAQFDDHQEGEANRESQANTDQRTNNTSTTQQTEAPTSTAVVVAAPAPSRSKSSLDALTLSGPTAFSALLGIVQAGQLSSNDDGSSREIADSLVRFVSLQYESALMTRLDSLLDSSSSSQQQQQAENDVSQSNANSRFRWMVENYRVAMHAEMTRNTLSNLGIPSSSGHSDSLLDVLNEGVLTVAAARSALQLMNRGMAEMEAMMNRARTVMTELNNVIEETETNVFEQQQQIRQQIQQNQQEQEDQIRSALATSEADRRNSMIRVASSSLFPHSLRTDEATTSLSSTSSSSLPRPLPPSSSSSLISRSALLRLAMNSSVSQDVQQNQQQQQQHQQQHLSSSSSSSSSSRPDCIDGASVAAAAAAAAVAAALGNGVTDNTNTTTAASFEASEEVGGGGGGGGAVAGLERPIELEYIPRRNNNNNNNGHNHTSNDSNHSNAFLKRATDCLNGKPSELLLQYFRNIGWREQDSEGLTEFERAEMINEARRIKSSSISQHFIELKNLLRGLTGIGPKNFHSSSEIRLFKGKENNGKASLHLHTMPKQTRRRVETIVESVERFREKFDCGVSVIPTINLKGQLEAVFIVVKYRPPEEVGAREEEEDSDDDESNFDEEQEDNNRRRRRRPRRGDLSETFSESELQKRRRIQMQIREAMNNNNRNNNNNSNNNGGGREEEAAAAAEEAGGGRRDASSSSRNQNNVANREDSSDRSNNSASSQQLGSHPESNRREFHQGGPTSSNNSNFPRGDSDHPPPRRASFPPFPGAEFLVDVDDTDGAVMMNDSLQQPILGPNDFRVVATAQRNSSSSSGATNAACNDSNGDIAADSTLQFFVSDQPPPPLPPPSQHSQRQAPTSLPNSNQPNGAETQDATANNGDFEGEDGQNGQRRRRRRRRNEDRNRRPMMTTEAMLQELLNSLPKELFDITRVCATDSGCQTQGSFLDQLQFNLFPVLLRSHHNLVFSSYSFDDISELPRLPSPHILMVDEAFLREFQEEQHSFKQFCSEKNLYLHTVPSIVSSDVLPLSRAPTQLLRYWGADLVSAVIAIERQQQQQQQIQRPLPISISSADEREQQYERDIRSTMFLPDNASRNNTINSSSSHSRGYSAALINSNEITNDHTRSGNGVGEVAELDDDSELLLNGVLSVRTVQLAKHLSLALQNLPWSDEKLGAILCYVLREQFNGDMLERAWKAVGISITPAGGIELDEDTFASLIGGDDAAQQQQLCLDGLPIPVRPPRPPRGGGGGGGGSSTEQAVNSYAYSSSY